MHNPARSKTGSRYVRHFPAAHALPRIQPSFADKIHVTLVAVYVAFAGIYWFPGVSHVLISQTKLALFALFVMIGLLRFRIYSARQLSVYFWLGACALAAFLANSITSGVEIAVDPARSFIEPLLWLIALYGVRPRAYPVLFSRLKITLTIFFFISLFPVGVYIGFLPNFYAPDALVDPTGLRLDKEWVLEAASIVRGGFAGGSTGWGATVGTAALMTAALYMRGHRAKGRAFIIATVIIAGSATGVVIVGARSGVFALVAVVAYGVAVARRGVRVSGIILIASFLLFASFLLLILSIDLVTFLPERFFRNFDTAGDLFTRLDVMTTGRLESYVGGLRHFAESPIIGKGPVDTKVWVNNAQYVTIHNLWIRQLAESGIIVFLPLIFLTAQLVSLALVGINSGKAARIQQTPEWPNTRLVILFGLIMALAAPSVVIGSFNANAIIWTAVWSMLAGSRDRVSPAMRAG